MTLNTCLQHVLLVPPPPIRKFLFAPQTVVFELHSVLRQVHRMTPNDVEHQKETYVIHVLPVSLNPRLNVPPYISHQYPRLKFQFIFLCSQPFSNHRSFEASVLNDPQTTLYTEESMCSTSAPNLNFNQFCSTASRF